MYVWGCSSVCPEWDWQGTEEVPAKAEHFLWNLVFCQGGIFVLGINILLQNLGFYLLPYYRDLDTVIYSFEVVQMF